MPLYEYSCPKCGEKQEILARTAETPLQPTCPVCRVPMAKEWAPVAAYTKSGGDSGCAPRGGFS